MRRVLAIGTLLACAVVAASSAPTGSSSTKADCSLTRTGLIPLTDMGKRKYRGYRGGLYPGGLNRAPQAYLRKGIEAAKRVRPIDGKIVLLSIGMSNASDEFSAFKRAADRDPQKNSSLVVVDGAQDGFDSRRARSQPVFWENIDQRLSEAEVTPEQVQAVWLKQSVAGEQRRFPKDARGLQSDLRAILRIMRVRYPNVKLVYLSSRTYGGYAITGLNPEPAAYDSAYAVRGIIQERIRGKIKGPWLFWGPYLWTDGMAGRNDGLVWTCDDVEADGTHPSRSGVQKVVTMLTTFFKADPTARRWYVAKPL
ncbi:MAG TPA: hypothetical protein VFT86_10675 [Gaiellaceae bacterium]|nr:hypothetical protein [Gaiellaceae bacterium]